MKDAGWIYPSSVCRISFPFENVGNQPLNVEIKATGCSCTKARLDKELVEPGGRGSVEVELDLTTKRGPFASFISLKTNDVRHPDILIRAAAGVYQSYGLSHKYVSFGRVRLGEEKSTQFYALDRGDNTLNVSKAHITSPTLSDLLSPKVSLIRKGQESVGKSMGFGYSIHPGDCLITLSITPSDNMPLGKFEGILEIESNQIREKKPYVAFSGEITSNITAEPAAIIVSPSESIKTLTLTERSNHTIRLKHEPVVTNDLGLTVTAIAGPPGVLLYQIEKTDWGSEVILQKGSIDFTFQDDKQVSVPVYAVQTR